MHFKADLHQWGFWSSSWEIMKYPLQPFLFMLFSLSIFVDCDTHPVKHTSCENGHLPNRTWSTQRTLVPPDSPGSLWSDRLQFASRSTTELMTSDLSNTAINACYLGNKMIQFVFFSRWVIGSAHHWHVNLLLGLGESIQTGMLIYLNWSGSCSYEKVLGIC